MKKQHIPSKQSLNFDRSVRHIRRMQKLYFNLDLPLYPFCFEDMVRDDEPVWFESPGGNFAMLVAMESGSCLYRIGGKKYRAEQGRILWVPEFTPYAFSSSDAQQKYVLEIKGAHLTSMLHALGLDQCVLCKIPEFEQFLTDLKTIGKQVDTSDRSLFLSLMGKTYELLMRLSVEFLDSNVRKSPIPDILNFLEENLEEKRTVADLEQYTGINRTALIRMVKKHTGITPMRYRILRKMERAVFFLQVPEMPVKEIAYRLGYCNPFYFAEEFRRFMGKSPTDYRLFQQKMMRENRSGGKTGADTEKIIP